MHPALLDLALSYDVTAVEGATALLPWRYEKVRVFAPLAPTVFSHARVRSRQDGWLALDVDLRDGSSGQLLAAGGRLYPAAGLGLGRRPSALPAGACRPLRNPFGITRDEGVEVFLRALDTAEPVISVSTVEWRQPPCVVAIPGTPAKKPASRAARKGRNILLPPPAGRGGGLPGSLARKER